MNVHTGTRPYKCNDCGKDFASKYSARAHEKTHTERPRPYKCSQCNKSFITEQNLLQHERTHVAVRSYSCQVCGNLFNNYQHIYNVKCIISWMLPSPVLLRWQQGVDFGFEITKLVTSFSYY